MAQTSCANAVDVFVDAASRDALVVSVDPQLGIRWLPQRLPRLLADPAGANLDLRFEGRMADFVTDGVDVGLRYGRGEEAGVERALLFREQLFPVCSPELAGYEAIRDPAGPAHGDAAAPHPPPVASVVFWLRPGGTRGLRSRIRGFTDDHRGRRPRHGGGSGALQPRAAGSRDRAACPASAATPSRTTLPSTSPGAQTIPSSAVSMRCAIGCWRKAGGNWTPSRRTASERPCVTVTLRRSNLLRRDGAAMLESRHKLKGHPRFLQEIEGRPFIEALLNGSD